MHNREQLEAVVNQFALQIIKQYELRAKPEHFKIFLSHDIVPTAVMKWGEPVQIFVKELDLVEALVNKGAKLTEFRQLIASCLRTVPRLHPATAITIPATIIKQEEGRWHAHKGEESELFPNLIPEERISYKIRLYVEATDTETKRTIRFVTRNLDVDKMRRDVRETLSAPPETNAAEPE